MQLEVGAIVEGKVTGITSFGAFVDLEGGKTGMVHISEVAPVFVSDINNHIHIGEKVTVKILGISPEGKISLSIKRALPPDAAAAPGSPPPPRPPRREAPPPRTWQPKPQPTGEQSFEEMMSRFKQQSDEKISELKRSVESKRGSGGPRRH